MKTRGSSRLLVRAITFSAALGCSAVAPASTTTLSVLYFDNLSGAHEYAHLSKALAEMLINDLSRVEGIALVEREQLEKVMKELALGLTGVVDESTSPKIGKILGAAYLISGNYLVERRDVAVNYKVVEVESGTIMASGAVQERASRMLRVKDAMSASVVTALKKVFPELVAPSAQPDAPEVPLEQIARYGQALDQKDRGNYREAKDLLAALSAQAPSFSYAKKELADLGKRIKEYDKKREQLLEEEGSKPVTWQSFIQTTVGYTSAMKYTRLLEYCLGLRDSPPETPEGSMVTASEYIDYYVSLAHYQLKQWDKLVEEGEAFLKDHPTSMYYASVKMYVSQGINELKNEQPKLDRANARVQALLEQAAAANADQRAMLFFQVATTYMGEQLSAQALEYYRKIDLGALEKQGIAADQVLYGIFTCYYNLRDRKEAERICKTVETLYPQSAMLQAMQTMIAMFPE
jgi:TolB-like protein